MAEILASIDRVSPHDARALSTLVHLDERGRKVTPGRPLAGYGFRSMSREAPKLDHWWAFPVDRRTHRLSTGSRAVLEVVRGDPSIRKVVLTRSRHLQLDGENLVVRPLGSREGTEELARCGLVLLDENADDQLALPMPAAWHRLVHVGGGLPIGPIRLDPAELEAESRTGGARRGIARRGAGASRRLTPGGPRGPVADGPSPPRPRRPDHPAGGPGPRRGRAQVAAVRTTPRGLLATAGGPASQPGPRAARPPGRMGGPQRRRRRRP